MVTSRLVARCGCGGVRTPVGGTSRCGLASISTTSLSKIIGRSSDAVRRWLGSNRSRTQPSQLLASNWRIEFARGSSRLAAAVGAMIGRGRRNGQWHSHRNKFGAQRASSRSKYPVLHQNRLLCSEQQSPLNQAVTEPHPEIFRKNGVCLPALLARKSRRGRYAYRDQGGRTRRASSMPRGKHPLL